MASPNREISDMYWRGHSIESWGETDVGKVRKNNQDSIFQDSSIGLYMVADGMGGRAGGEIASSLAVESVGDFIRRRVSTLCQQRSYTNSRLLTQAVNSASLKIFETGLHEPQYRGMGTTSTFLWVPPPGNSYKEGQVLKGTVTHVGDSRCYLLRAGLFYQVTDDHSLVNEQMKAGLLKENDPIIKQMKNVITRCVGYQETEEVDTVDLALYKGDRFLLCSDGLSNKVEYEEISDLLSSLRPKECVRECVRLANERGGEDNITALVVTLL